MIDLELMKYDHKVANNLMPEPIMGIMNHNHGKKVH